MPAEIGRRDFVVSIKPTYAKKIVDGEKTVELRRKFASEIDDGAFILIYSSSPVRAVVGMAKIDRVECLPLAKLWRRHGNAACVEKKFFDLYFSGKREGYAIVLGDVLKFEEPVSIDKLKKKVGFVPPQSFSYLSQDYYTLIQNERVQAPHRY